MPYPRDEVFALSLGVRHPNLELRSLLESWGLTVFRSWVAGEIRTSPKGRLIGGTWPTSYATADLPLSDDRRLESSIATALDALEPRRNDIVSFVEQGGHANFFVGWGFAHGSGGAELDWQVLARLAENRIALDLDVYSGRGSELEEADRDNA